MGNEGSLVGQPSFSILYPHCQRCCQSFRLPRARKKSKDLVPQVAAVPRVAAELVEATMVVMESCHPWVRLRLLKIHLPCLVSLWLDFRPLEVRRGTRFRADAQPRVQGNLRSQAKGEGRRWLPQHLQLPFQTPGLSIVAGRHR